MKENKLHKSPFQQILHPEDFTEYVRFPCHLERTKWLFDTITFNRDPNFVVNILDIGCGTGNVTIPLGLIEYSYIRGIDIHEGNISVARTRNTMHNVDIVFEDLFNCEIKDFDFVILTEVLEHISYYKLILSYLSRNMNTGAELLLTVPNGRGPLEIAMGPLYLMRKLGLHKSIDFIKKIVGKKEPYSLNYDTPHVNFFTVKRLTKELQMFGFRVLEVKKAYIISPVIETYLPFIPLNYISKVDNKLAQMFPQWLSSGHYYRIYKE